MRCFVTEDKQYTVDILAAMAERTIKRLWVLIILLIVLLFGTNAAWIVYESQFVSEESVVEIDADQDADGGSNYVVGGDYDG